jgi:hypothetical protein
MSLEEFLISNRMNSTTTHPNMKSFDITCNGITKLLKQLNPYKAPGPDNISPHDFTGQYMLHSFTTD